MKVIAWLFNYTSRHYRDIVSYNKGKLLGRIFILILELILVGGCFAIWYWAKAQDEFLKLLLISIFVFMPVVYMSIDYSFLYNYIIFIRIKTIKIFFSSFPKHIYFLAHELTAHVVPRLIRSNFRHLLEI